MVAQEKVISQLSSTLFQEREVSDGWDKTHPLDLLALYIQPADVLEG